MSLAGAGAARVLHGRVGGRGREARSVGTMGESLSRGTKTGSDFHFNKLL